MDLRYALMLQSPISIAELAKNFVSDLITKSNAEQSLSLEVAANFINDFFEAIRFNQVKCTAEDLISRFKKYEKFIEAVCFEFKREVDKGIAANKEWPADLHPVKLLIGLLDIWEMCCVSLKSRSASNAFSLRENDRFDEPIARINARLFCGCSKFLNMNHLPMIRKCAQLLHNSRLGLFFSYSNSIVFKLIFPVFLENFSALIEHNTSCMEIIYTVLCVSSQVKTEILMFEILTKELREPNFLLKYSNTLLNYLVSKHFLNAFFTKIHESKNKKFIIVCLEYLFALQSHIVSRDCFGYNYLEVLLSLICKYPQTNIGSRAARAYISLAQSSQTNATILKHIIAYFASTEPSPNNLQHYVDSFWNYFSYIQKLDNLIPCILEDPEDSGIRFLSSRFAFCVYHSHTKNIEKYESRKEVEDFLCSLPKLLERFKCPTTFAILFRIFSETELMWLINNFSKALTIIQQIQTFSITRFQREDSPYLIMYNLFMESVRCMVYTESFDEIRNVNNQIEERFFQLFDDYEISEPDVTPQIYNNIMKISIMTKESDQEAINKPFEMTQYLFSRMFNDGDQIWQIAQRFPKFDAYALEVLTSVFIMATKEGTSETPELQEILRQLKLYFIQYLKDLENTEEVDLFKVKTCFCSLIKLLMTFSDPEKQYYKVTFDLPMYGMLIGVITEVVFGKRLKYFTEKDPNFDFYIDTSARHFEFRRMILLKFTQLHIHPNIKIPGNTVWKLIIFFGWKTKFNEELALLMRAVAVHHPQIYKHIVSVAIHNLYKQEPALEANILKRILKAHDCFIDKNIGSPDNSLFKGHIVLGVIDILKKTLQVIQLNNRYNRLESLKYLLHIFGKDQQRCIPIATPLHSILEEVCELENSLLTTNERHCLKNFIQDVEELLKDMYSHHQSQRQ